MLSIYHIMLLAMYTAQVKKRVKKDFKKRKIVSLQKIGVKEIRTQTLRIS